jgi:SAM-dependent methyltransferase
VRESEGLTLALRHWTETRATGASHGVSCAAATQAVLDAGADRWEAQALAGALARARPQVLPDGGGVGARLDRVAAGSRRAVWSVGPGGEVPTWDSGGRKRRGAFDTPRDLAREVVAAALAAATGPTRRGLDPACGTGAFLLALDEVGLEEIVGVDPDPVALAVAAVLVPRAQLHQRDAFSEALPQSDVVVGNPPFVPPERQHKGLRRQLTARVPWLRGRFDLAVPFAEVALECTRPGGGLALVLPAAMTVQPYGETWRRRWLAQHSLRSLRGPVDFPGASVQVVLLGLTRDGTPGPVPGGLPSADVLSLPAAPLDPHVSLADLALARRVRTASKPLGSLCRVDTGLVAHGPLGGKARLLRDGPGPGRVPFVDAQDLFAGEQRWLSYRPQEMHRPKSPALFEAPKLLIQRLRGGASVRAQVDRTGLYAGHTLLVAQPHPASPVDPERLLKVVCAPVAQAVNRVERGARLDLYPQDLRDLPVPTSWLAGGQEPLPQAWGLTLAEADTLARLATF